MSYSKEKNELIDKYTKELWKLPKARKESLKERLKRLWNEFLEKERKEPSRVTFSSDHIKGRDFSKDPLEGDVHYFSVQVNEMYLPYQSKLWVKLDPTVFVTTEFNYDGKKESVPFVVGPSMMGIPDDKIPEGMIFKDTKVAGLHPYKGGDFTLAIILCRIQRKSYGKKLLKIVEAVAGALDYSTQVSSYLQLANVVVDGIEEMMGIKDLSPLFGLRTEFHQDVGPSLKESFFALINTPQNELNEDELWVLDNELCKGKSFSDSKPYRDADYVLYSIKATTKRTDLNFLNFNDAWKRVKEDAMKPDAESWKRAKAGMNALRITMYNSPDLTTKHALKAAANYKKEMKELHDIATNPKNHQ